MKIIIDDRIPFIRGVFEPYAETVYLAGSAITAAECADADALIVRTRTKCGRSLLENSQVKFIATATIGFDHLAADELEQMGIKWRNAPGCNAESVKNYISSALAAVDRDLNGLTLGVIGVGNVGRKVAALGSVFGMNVLLNDPPRADAEGSAGFTSLDELLAKSDIISVHVPLENGGRYPTADLADERFFAAVKRGAMFFNSCRGEILVTDAFKAAVRSGRISSALMDVWPNEPDIDRELMSMVDFGTPHIAGYSKDGKANGTTAAVRETAKFFGIKELYGWKAENLPPPEFPSEIVIDSSLPEFQQVNRAILHAYDIRRDVNTLYESPEKFEKLRGTYWNRREFSAYTVRGASAGAAEKLQNAGFNIS